MKSFWVSGKVFIWPGEMGWHFVYLDKNLAEKIRKVAKTYGSGFVRVNAKLGKTSWGTALFPYKKENTFLLSIKKDVRIREGIYQGDSIKIKIILA